MEEKAGLLLLLLFLQFPRISLACLGCHPPLFLPAHTLAKSRAVRVHRARGLKIYFVKKCKTFRSKFKLASFNYS